MDDKLPKCGTEPMNADHFIHLHWPSHDKIKMLLIEVVKERDEQWRAMSVQAPGMEAMMKWVADLTELCPRPIDDDNGTSDQCIERGHCGCNHAEARAALQAAERGKA